MKILVALVTVISLSAVSLSAAPALAGDSQISKHSLARMGLQGMTTMSDADGMSIRGQAILVAFDHTFISNHNQVDVVASASGVTSGFIGVGVTSSFTTSKDFLVTGGMVTVSAH
jgi:hypothetical protein